MPPDFPPWVKVKTLPVSTHTAASAAVALGVEIGQIAKSLVFYSVASQLPIVIIVSGKNRVDKDMVSAYLGFKIKTASPEYVHKVTGYPVGGVPPLSHIQNLRTLMDKDLFRYSSIWAAAGTPFSLFSASPNQLATATSAEIIGVS